jgi:hypothetical protein
VRHEALMSLLADYPFDMVRLACRKCPRKGQYRKATLLEERRVSAPRANMHHGRRRRRRSGGRGSPGKTST